MTPAGKQIIGNRYQLRQKLGEGGMGTVYRAFDRLNRHDIALKQVVSEADQLDPTTSNSMTDMRVALAQEFQMLASLRHPHVISVIDYGFDQSRQPYFTMSYVQNAQTILAASQDQPEIARLRLLVEMLQALAYVHRRGIIHRDLKPDNVLVSAEGDVKVLDFGIALLHDQKQNLGMATGTLGYMAPEVLQGSPATVESDLYAVGIIACEIFVGQHPFGGGGPSELITRVLTQTIELDDLDVSPQLGKILIRLLEKDPEDRYQDANSVISALSQAMEQPAPQETQAIRESFLQAARFVGRDAELAQLSDALSEAVAGQGSLWLVGGESGVGKSRLLDELRVRALVKGALAIRGWGILESEQSYELWREPLRRLVLSSDINDTDAAVLREWVTDLDELLERPVPDAPRLEGRAGQRRLLETIERVFRAQPVPVVLILEDLQWALESLDVLKRLQGIIGALPLMIVCDYRDDEAPDLPDELPGAQALTLKRLSERDIEELSASMLGRSGRQPNVVQFLQKETEGNVFFVVEVVRALAEQAGRLDLIGQTALPQEIVAGGIQQVVQRRLDHVPESALPLLRIAALAGRYLDLKLLAALDNQTDIEGWLTTCSNAAVLEIEDEQWRFSHDKLRDGLVKPLAENEWQATHLRVATTLEAIYADDIDEHAAVIGNHYEHADEPGRAADWYARAGSHAQSTYAPGLAIEYLQKALALWNSTADEQSGTLEQQMMVYRGLGSMLNWQANTAEAMEAFAAALGLAQEAQDLTAQANALVGLADTQLARRELRMALDDATKAEAIARQAGANPELARALFMRGWALFEMGDMEAALALGKEGREISKTLDHQQLLADTLNLTGVVNQLLGKYDAATNDLEQALATYQGIGNRVSAMVIVNNLGAIALERGDFDEAARRYQEALDQARELHYRDGELSFMTNLGGALAKMGDYEAARRQLFQVINNTDDDHAEDVANTYYYLAEAFLGQAELRQALEAGQQALILATAHESAEDLAATWRVLGQIASAVGTSLAIGEGDAVKQYDAVACFSESDRIADETGMEGERARTMREWARHAIAQGDGEQGQKLWDDARAIFKRLGAIPEVERMQTTPGAD